MGYYYHNSGIMLMGKRIACIGIVLLFVMGVFPSSSHSTSKIVNDTKIVPSGLFMTVSPDPGVYWNGHKILPCQIYFILHGKLPMVFTVIPTSNTSDPAYVEFYINGVCQWNASSPGPYVYCIVWGGRVFLKTSCTITAKDGLGDSVSKEIVIFRLFW